MRFSALLASVVSGLLVGESLALGSFNRDVVSKVAKKERGLHQQQNVEDELFEKAMPLEDYRRIITQENINWPFCFCFWSSQRQQQRPSTMTAVAQ